VKLRPSAFQALTLMLQDSVLNLEEKEDLRLLLTKSEISVDAEMSASQVIILLQQGLLKEEPGRS